MARNNECIEERNDSYRVRITYYDEDGCRQCDSKSFSIRKYGTKQKALEMARKYRDEMKVLRANRGIVRKKDYTLEEVYQGMMDIYNCSLGTKKKVDGTYHKYIRPFIGAERDFASIKFDDIQKCLNAMVSICKDDTIMRAKGIWNRLYRYAVAKDIVYKDETYNVTIPKSDIVTIKKPMTVTFEEVMEMINLLDQRIENRRDSVLMQGALLIQWYTGMRPSEVMALDKKNIDLDYMSIYVCQSVGSTSTEMIAIKKTKNENSIRHIPIVEGLIPVLNRLYDISIDDLLFMRDNGQLMTGNFLSSACQRLSGNKFRPYTIRHQFSTDLMMSGANIRTIQEMMGHAHSDMTISYARSNDQLKRKALENRQMS